MRDFLETNALFQCEYDVQQICHPMFSRFDLQYFSYGRFYKDGRCLLLCTNRNVFMHHFDKQYKLILLPEEIKSNKKTVYNLIMVNHDSSSIIQDEYNLFGHGTMMDVITKHDEYYEMFCFVSKKNSMQEANIFLNNLGVLEGFSENFLTSANDIIKKANSQAICLPASMRPELIFNETRDKDAYLIDTEGIFLSKRQYECLSLMSAGKTSKEIAILLDISYRTVQKYTELTKERLGCSKKTELIKIALRNDLNKYALSMIKRNEKKHYSL